MCTIDALLAYARRLDLRIVETVSADRWFQYETRARVL
jgi:hypothetical protein